MRAKKKEGGIPFSCMQGPKACHLGALLLVLTTGNGWSAEVPALAAGTSADSGATAPSGGEAASEDDDDVPIRISPPASDATLLLPARPGRAPAYREEAPALEWGIPPVPWRAQLTLGSGWNRAGDGGGASTFSKALSMQANSYVWQPWFARVDGSATFSENDTRDDSGKATGTGAGGDIGISLLPSSRFPFNLRYAQQSSRAESRSVSSSAVSRRLSMDQRYRPPEGGYNLAWGYSLNELETSQAGRNVVNALNGNLSVPMPGDNPQSLSVSGAWTRNRADTGASSDFGNVSAMHSIYLEDYVMTISSDVFAAANQLHSPSLVSENKLVQAGSNFDWIPDDDSPLRLAGGLRGFNTNTRLSRGDEIDSSRISTLNGQLSANYPLSQSWVFGGSLNGLGTWTRDAADNSSHIAQVIANANANWRGEGWRRKIDRWDYQLSYGSSSFASSSYRRDSDGLGRSQQVLGVSGSVGHSAGRQFEIDGHRNPLGVSFGQNLGTSRDLSGGAVHSLNHSATGNWQLDTKPDVQANLSVNASDTRSYGETTTNYQSVQASLSGNAVLGGYSSVVSNLGVQFNRQASGTGGGDWQGSAAGAVTYTRARFGDVTGLQYSARYNVNVRPGARRDLGETAEKEFQVDHQISQSWGWRLGLLGWRLENTFSYAATGDTSASVFLTVTRDFGGVL